MPLRSLREYSRVVRALGHGKLASPVSGLLGLTFFGLVGHHDAGAACPGRARPLSALRPCAPVGLSHRAGGAAIAAGEGWSPAGGSRGGAL